MIFLEWVDGEHIIAYISYTLFDEEISKNPGIQPVRDGIAGYEAAGEAEEDVRDPRGVRGGEGGVPDVGMW